MEETHDLLLKFESENDRNELADIIANSDRVSVEYDSENQIMIIPKIND